MKKLLIYISFVSAITLAGCTKNFDSLNTDPTRASASTFDPNLLLPTAELGYLSAIQGYAGPLLFQSMWVQTFADAEYPAYYSNGDKYVASSNILTYEASTWNNAYGSASNAYEIQNLTATNDALSNLRGIALIVELMNFQVVTDTYGDCPYSQALQAKTGISLPVYDKQQDIYTSMLSRLDSVLGTLDATKAKPTNDIIYSGDVNQWKKFGYSLMLRMAMRLTKADAATAQKYAEKAYTGGTFASNADNAYITFDHADGYSNGNTSALQVPEDFSQVRWGKVLITLLKASADPRLGVIAEVPKQGSANNLNESLDGDHTVANQIGMPNGYDQNGGATDISTEPNYPGTSPADPSISGDKAFVVGKYSRPTTAVYVRDLNTPGFIFTYAETELLLAEAAVRGWSVGPSASVHYANGLSAAIQSYGTFNAAGAISASVADAYAALPAVALDVSSTTNSLAQINTQYWITAGTLFDFSEAWSNWRRSGYPVLTPVNYTGNFTGGTIPRREQYPSTEATLNPANEKAAIANLSGGDLRTSKVWWDQ